MENVCAFLVAAGLACQKERIPMAEIQLQTLNTQARSFPRVMIARAEDVYTEKLHTVADAILSGDQTPGMGDLVLLAGPSSSGKTTTANLLCDLLAARGHAARVVSLDDFYRDPDDPDYPRLPDGRHDFECVDSLRIDKIHEMVEAILVGRDISIPRFDFRLGRPIEDAQRLCAAEGGIVILEGLHALNPRLIAGLPSDGVHKLFVSVSTNIMEGEERILSGRKIRFVRRLVRDAIFRATDAKKTLSLWQNVLHGEDLYLYPYKETADFKFDTFHSFELGALGPRALALLRESEICDPYVDVVMRALEKVEPIPLEYIPAESLIREFLAGGVYEERY